MQENYMYLLDLNIDLKYFYISLKTKSHMIIKKGFSKYPVRKIPLEII